MLRHMGWSRGWAWGARALRWQAERERRSKRHSQCFDPLRTSRRNMRLLYNLHQITNIHCDKFLSPRISRQKKRDAGNDMKGVLVVGREEMEVYYQCYGHQASAMFD